MFQIQWADACLLVYSVTDRSSFEYATEVLSTLKRAPPNGGSPAHAPGGAQSAMPLALLGNKTDLDHLRQVRTYLRSKLLLATSIRYLHLLNDSD